MWGTLFPPLLEPGSIGDTMRMIFLLRSQCIYRTQCFEFFLLCSVQVPEVQLYSQHNEPKIRLILRMCDSDEHVTRRASRLGQGQLPQNLGLVPKCHMKHCLMNSTHWHIGAKRSVLWPTKYENLYSPKIHPVANNMREHREKLNELD